MASFLGELTGSGSDSGTPRLPLGLGTKLSAKVVRTSFASKELDPSSAEVSASQWKMSASNRMRWLDDVHKHSPLEEECADLNIPNDRLDLHRTQDILFLAGGCCGVRFSSAEMALIAQLRADLQPAWDVLDGQFKALDSSLRKKVLTGGPYARGVPPSEFAESDADAEAAVNFHRSADDYLALMRRLQVLIQDKQASSPRRASGDATLSLPKFDKDPDANAGKAMPDWMSLLLAKYQTAQQPSRLPDPFAAGAAPAAHSLKAGATVGKFAVFLSACVVGTVACNDEEWSAVAQVLHASNDSQAFFTLDGRVQGCGAGAPYGDAAPPSQSQSQPQPQPQRYWASRIFNFLSALTELKTLPRDEKSLSSVP